MGVRDLDCWLSSGSEFWENFLDVPKARVANTGWKLLLRTATGISQAYTRRSRHALRDNKDCLQQLGELTTQNFAVHHHTGLVLRPSHQRAQPGKKTQGYRRLGFPPPHRQILSRAAVSRHPNPLRRQRSDSFETETRLG